MVHRPADSRLLANLLAHEKEHAKALHQLSTTAQASLAPLAAYAAASTPSAAAALGAAARALSQADGALRAYAEAVDEWRAMLSELKGLEDEVGNIQRDREILVTRLIKASNIKPTSLNRNSFIGVTSSTYSTNNSSKLDLAQSELQACETHLASRERDLQALRALALSRGLKGRCTAMSECGWQWNEAGKEGLRALEEMDRALPNGFTAGTFYSHFCILHLA
ncbi:hypothetical protein BD410DRAFT_719841 [Rickenella mellea]|uniref:Uncharacterized protein n=1 Tax=Rickenella mellea TaxID=50990 RepID=A0A4Y7QAG0_9AGAM|nr:hypothetical protein BD410DRAFT_719841 [Rickenella mellea]